MSGLPSFSFTCDPQKNEWPNPQYIKLMYSLPKEIHREILSWLEPEEQQVTRLTDRYFAGLIQPQKVNLLIFGATHGLLEYCEIGLSRGNSKQYVCNRAARHGRLEVLKWARSQECTWDEWTCAWAAEGGHLEVLKWVRTNGCPWNEETCSWAAENGHLEVLKWAKANGCRWGEETCTYAAENGHLEVLQYAIKNGCPWDFRYVDISECPQHIQDYLVVLHE